MPKQRTSLTLLVFAIVAVGLWIAAENNDDNDARPASSEHALSPR